MFFIYIIKYLNKNKIVVFYIVIVYVEINYCWQIRREYFLNKFEYFWFVVEIVLGIIDLKNMWCLKLSVNIVCFKFKIVVILYY